MRSEGPKYVIRKSFQEGYIRDGEVWMEALEFRNKAAHVYDNEILQDVLNFACRKIFPCAALHAQLFQAGV